MKYTANLKLKKPEGTDVVNIDDLNDNVDILDREITQVKDKANNINAGDIKLSDGKTIEGKFTEVQGNIGNINDSTLPVELKGKSLTEQTKQLFQSGLDGKNLLETSIKSKGGMVSKQGTVATFNELDLGIKSIETGDYAVGDFIPATKLKPNLSEIWTFEKDLPINAIAADQDGYVYIGGEDNVIRKISPEGNQVWSWYPHEANGVKAIAVDQHGYVYGGWGNGIVRKISPDGSHVWFFSGHTDVVNAIAVDNGGYVYTASNDQTVRRIEGNGNEIWKYTGERSPLTAIAVDRNRYAYIGSSIGTVRKLKFDGSYWEWHHGASSSVTTIAVDKTGSSYVGYSNGYVRKTSPEGGVMWTYSTGWGVSSIAVDQNGCVYKTESNKLVKLNSLGSKMLESIPHGNVIFSIAVDNKGYVYAAGGKKSSKMQEGYSILE